MTNNLNNDDPNDDPNDDLVQINNNSQTSDEDEDEDLKNHGVHSIIPDNDEYYTLELGRNFDDNEDNDDELGGLDVASVDPTNLDAMNEPVGSSSLYEDATIVKKISDHPRTSRNSGGVGERHILDEDTSSGYNVGDPGHMGIDDEEG
ncbi:hypothetical protein BH09PAT1_BH09PAT1_2400 [soil metagenome]